MLHDLNQSNHRADDSNGWREPTGGLENFWQVFLVLGLIVEVQLHHFSKLLRLGTVHGEHQGFFQEWVGDLLYFAVERHDAVFSRLVGKAHHLSDLRRGVCAFDEKYRAQPPKSLQDNGKRELQHDCPNCPAQHHDCRGGLHDLGDLPAFQGHS